jgi:hypothetical protein
MAGIVGMIIKSSILIVGAIVCALVIGGWEIVIGVMARRAKKTTSLRCTWCHIENPREKVVTEYIPRHDASIWACPACSAKNILNV